MMLVRPRLWGLPVLDMTTILYRKMAMTTKDGRVIRIVFSMQGVRSGRRELVGPYLIPWDNIGSDCESCLPPSWQFL
jgi:hypothetical protein